MNFNFEEIPADKVEKQARGRKPSQTTQDLAEAFRNVKAGRALVLNGMEVDPNSKTQKAALSSTIRQAAKIAERTVKIDFRTNGLAQVTVIK